MAQYDMTMEVGVKPVVDIQDVKKAAASLEKEFQKVKSFNAPLAKKASSVINMLMASGYAEGPVQGRMILEKMVGGKLNAPASAIMRAGQNISSSELTIAKNQQKTLDTFEKRYLRTQRSVSGFLDNPTAKGRESLLEGIASLEEDTKELLKTYKKSGQEVPKILKDSSKSTKKWQNEVLKAKIPFSFGTGIAGLFSGLAGLAGLGSLANFTKRTVEHAFTRGKEDITEQLMYGENRDIALTEALANLYGMEEKTVALPFQKAITFAARRKSRQLSQEEMVGWSRLGLADLITSGEAATNQRAFAMAFMARLRAFQGNEPELMSILQQIGVSPELAKFNLSNYTAEDIQKEIERYEPIVVKRKLGGIESIEKGRHLRYGEAAYGAAGTNLVSGLLGETAARRSPQIFSKEEKKLAQDWQIIGSPQPNLEKDLYKLALTPAVNIINNNTFNVEGGDSEDTAKKTKEQLENMNMGKLADFIKMLKTM